MARFWINIICLLTCCHQISSSCIFKSIYKMSIFCLPPTGPLFSCTICHSSLRAAVLLGAKITLLVLRISDVRRTQTSCNLHDVVAQLSISQSTFNKLNKAPAVNYEQHHRTGRDLIQYTHIGWLSAREQRDEFWKSQMPAPGLRLCPPPVGASFCTLGCPACKCQKKNWAWHEKCKHLLPLAFI